MSDNQQVELQIRASTSSEIEELEVQSQSRRSTHQNEEAGKNRLPARRYLWRHIWLIYSLFMFIPLFYEVPKGFVLELSIAFPIFLALYFLAWHGPTLNWRRAAVAGMSLLGFIYVPMNPGAAGIFVYSASILPTLTRSVPAVFWFMGLQSAGTLLQAWICNLSPWSWIVSSAIAVLTGINTLRFVQQDRADKQLRLAHAEVEHLAKLAERERIARDLHDVLGHTLSLIVLKSELAQRIQERDPARAQKEMQEVEQTARHALSEVRQAIRGYRSEGIKAELGRAQKMLDAAGIQFSPSEQLPALPPAAEAVFSMIVREAVTNIVRHSKAQQCQISFESTAEEVGLIIQDNGTGEIKTEGSGIRGMRERIELLGGSFIFQSNQGTKLTVRLPHADNQAKVLPS